LDALFRLAQFAILDKDYDGARELLRRSVAEAERIVRSSWLNVRGKPSEPMAPGLAELAQLLDKASRAAYLMAAIKRAPGSAQRLSAESAGFLERQIETLKHNEKRLVGAVKDLREGNEELVTTIQALQRDKEGLAREIRELDTNNQRLAAEVREQHENAVRIAGEATNLYRTVNRLQQHGVTKPWLALRRIFARIRGG